MLNNPLLLRSKNNGLLTHIDFVRLRLARFCFTLGVLIFAGTNFREFREFRDFCKT